MFKQARKYDSKKIAMKYWKYSYDYNQTFTNELNFGIK